MLGRVEEASRVWGACGLISASWVQAGGRPQTQQHPVLELQREPACVRGCALPSGANLPHSKGICSQREGAAAQVSGPCPPGIGPRTCSEVRPGAGTRSCPSASVFASLGLPALPGLSGPFSLVFLQI